MFSLETEYLAWNFVSWTANFLLSTLVILSAAALLKMSVKYSFVESEACEEEERKLFAAVLEQHLSSFRTALMVAWPLCSWLWITAPLFFLLLFLAAVYIP